ncbi:MAG: LamG-like jellyroll fold domain-containing protein, partial [Planctomycetota bacterium]
MCKKLAVLLSLVMVLGLAGGASAGTWTNGDGDNDWCNPLNWSPAGVPTSTTDVVISGTPNDTVVIDSGCAAQARSVDWNVDADQEVRIEAGGSLTVQLGFDWSDGSETATLRIAGDLTIHGTGLDDSDHFRGPDSGTGLVFIELGANVYVEGQFRGADSSSGRLDVYMSGGDVNCLKYKCGDDGDGDFRMTGGRFVTRDTGLSDSFTIRGRGGGTFDVLIEGGAELWVAGGLMTPQNAEAKADVKINEATISCDEWVAQGPRWVVDINDNGELRIRESDGATKTLVEGWIDANQVIGKGGTLPPQITWDGPDLVLIIFFVHKTVYDPDPPDDAIDVCPDAVLSWSTGVYVADHNVYFGTDMNEVNEVGVPKQIHVGPNSWDPPGLLALNTTYYWRVDTVNDACAPYKWEGGIWSFTTSDGNAFAVSPEDGETGIVVDSNLVWNACEYTSFDVYFSLEVNDVNDRVVSARIATGITETTVDPCAGDLTPSRTYYWAVDKYVGPVKSEGDVWSFRSKPDIVDFDMIAWYKLDEGTGGDVFDASGYEHHADLDGPEDHWRNDGRWDGSRWFDDESDGTDVELPFELTSEITDKMSVSMWLLNSNRPGSDNWAFGIGDEDDYSFRAAVPAEDGQTLYFQAGNDTNDVLEWDMKRDGINPASLEDWHLYVFVKDEVANFTKIYFDAEVVDACDAVDQTLTNIAWAPGKLGAVPWHDSDLVAQMDDVRFFKKALSDGDVEELFRGGDVAKAWKPDPPSGATDVDTDVELSWRSGNFATHHDVYFGKDHAAVRDDDIGNSLGAYKGRQVVADTNWAPASELELGETYYWRIDEVNEANTPDDIWEGDVWSFTVANYVVIDDFEDYDDINR